MICIYNLTVSDLNPYSNDEEDSFLDGSNFEEDDDLSMMTDDRTGFIDDEVESVTSRVSKITFGDETAVTGKSFRTNHTGFKSILYKQSKRETGKHDLEKHGKKRIKTLYGSKNIGLPYIVDIWSSKRSRMSCSLQVLCLTGFNPKQTHFFRVSTDRMWLVLRVEMSESALDAVKAFYKVLKSLPAREREMLEYHTKFAARKTSVSKLTGRDSQKRVLLEQRLRLPFQCEHAFATKENDPFFYGIQFIKYPETGETWAHVELVQHIKDGYVGRDIANTTYMDSIVEEEGDDGYASDFGKNSVVMEDVDDNDNDIEDEVSVSPGTQTKSSYGTCASNGLPVETSTSQVHTPKKVIEMAPYPPMRGDKVKCSETRSLCREVTTNRCQAIVSQVPSQTTGTIVKKSSNHTYDGRITRASVKRAAKHQD